MSDEPCTEDCVPSAACHRGCPSSTRTPYASSGLVLLSQSYTLLSSRSLEPCRALTLSYLCLHASWSPPPEFPALPWSPFASPIGSAATSQQSSRRDVGFRGGSLPPRTTSPFPYGTFPLNDRGPSPLANDLAIPADVTPRAPLFVHMPSSGSHNESQIECRCGGTACQGLFAAPGGPIMKSNWPSTRLVFQGLGLLAPILRPGQPANFTVVPAWQVKHLESRNLEELKL